MGSWGIAMRDSDYGLDLLGSIMEAHLKQKDFTIFNVAEALEVIKADIMEEIRQANRGCFAEQLVHYFDETFPLRFTEGALLVAECFDDFYCTGELVVTEYVGQNYDPLDHHIEEVAVTPADLKILLDKLQSVQNPEHWKYQSWIWDSDREKWLVRIRFVYQTLKSHV